MMNQCNEHGWNDGDNEPCPYCCIDRRRAEVKRLEFTIKSFNEGINLCRTRYEVAEKRNSRVHNYAFDLRAEVERLKDQNLRIMRGDFGQICAYCSWESSTDGGSWEELQEHAATCKNRPERKIEARNKVLRETLMLSRSMLNKGGCLSLNETWATLRKIEEALKEVDD